MVDREKMLNVRMADSELRMIRELAESLGLSQSDAIRQLVRRAHAETFGPPKPRRKPKTK
ncbi:MAG TPA: ribbon-helix-helix protein, CopG family [Polyangiaceae bacterium]|jgi:Arc/MetJ-type ribon-helix-helix transcriptional regulator